MPFAVADSRFAALRLWSYQIGWTGIFHSQMVYDYRFRHWADVIAAESKRASPYPGILYARNWPAVSRVQATCHDEIRLAIEDILETYENS